MIRPEHFKGAANELRAQTWFLEQGWQVYVPVITQSITDFVVDNEGELRRVQVKTANVVPGDNFIVQLRLNDLKYADTWMFVVYETMMWLIPPGEIPNKKNITLFSENPYKKDYDPRKWRIA